MLLEQFVQLQHGNLQTIQTIETIVVLFSSLLNATEQKL